MLAQQVTTRKQFILPPGNAPIQNGNSTISLQSLKQFCFRMWISFIISEKVEAFWTFFCFELQCISYHPPLKTSSSKALKGPWK